ncbi:DUF4232 domain-containing protein [Pseudarthrobacter sp. ATCC 49987]|uniref:DUF4232 domain-containing protein n=1 Tax=Pseudarthrobacter sp. ATCC 49987 TaxID=2698204 RepID=UPI00136D9810|nr:DUF4232 domain-containing protein [Pseudarthrobacter sp. ATCC 49987]
MTAQRINNRLVFTTAAAAAALFLAGCGAGTPQSQTSSTPASSAASSPSQSAAAAAGPSSATPAPAASTPAGPALCKAAGLTATTDATGGGAAGSVYMQLILTNSGAEPCRLLGFAGVSLTADANGEPIGAPAARDEATPATDVLLAPGQAGTATLRYTQARNYSDCTVVPAAGFRIYPPEDTASLFIAEPHDACSNAGINVLTIGAFTAK